MATQPIPRLTPDQYLETEREACVRSEYIGGEMFSMGALNGESRPRDPQPVETSR